MGMLLRRHYQEQGEDKPLPTPEEEPKKDEVKEEPKKRTRKKKSE